LVPDIAGYSRHSLKQMILYWRKKFHEQKINYFKQVPINFLCWPSEHELKKLYSTVDVEGEPFVALLKVQPVNPLNFFFPRILPMISSESLARLSGEVKL
jgi:hypothetical protein